MKNLWRRLCKKTKGRGDLAFATPTETVSSQTPDRKPELPASHIVAAHADETNIRVENPWGD
jgi:hypothetical protein